MKWDKQTLMMNNQTIIEKGIGKNKRQAKRKALISLIKTLMEKGYIGYGFKQKKFVQKLPRRKRLDESESQDQNNQVKNLKRLNFLNLIKQKNQHKIIQAIEIQNILDAWTYALSCKNIDFCEKVLKKLFENTFNNSQEQKIIEENKNQEQLKQPILKQVSYVEQFKDPFQEDLTVFIRYQQLQRPKYQLKNFNPFKEDKNEKQKNVQIPSKIFQFVDQMIKNPSNINLRNYMNFSTIDQQFDNLKKQNSKNNQAYNDSTKNRTFFNSDFLIKFPIFEQDLCAKIYIPLKIVESLYNKVLFICQDFKFCIKILTLLEQNVQNIQFQNFIAENNYKINQQKINQEQNQKLKAQQYYKQMKKNLIIEMTYNLNMKLKSINDPNTLSIQGMLNYTTSHSKIQSIFQFFPKQPQAYISNKLQRKNNYNQFKQMKQFCTEQIILLVNKITKNTFIGMIKQLNQTFKIWIPFLFYKDQITDEFPAPFTIYKLLNCKIFHKISLCLSHVCKYYMNYMDSSKFLHNQVNIISQTPSFSNFQILVQLISQWLAQKYFILIISDNYQILHKKLQDFGFKCLKISINLDQKIIFKHNIMIVNPLNVSTDLLKNLSFDKVIIDQAHKVPEIISLLTLVKCIKKLYLIGDPQLPRSQMQCFLSRKYCMQQSLFQKYIKNGCKYLKFKLIEEQTNFSQQKINVSNFKLKNNPENRIFDTTIVQWIKNSIYQEDLICDNEQNSKRKTPFIKGFNWPSNQYRVCFVNFPLKNKNQNKHINYYQHSQHSKFINKQCFMISWIIAQVIKSGFTSLDQISCCSLNNRNFPILQSYLIKLLYKLNIPQVQWQSVFQTLIKELDGSEINKNDLIILLAADGIESQIKYQKASQQKNNQKNKQESNTENIYKYVYDKSLRKLTSAFLQAERGLIIIGNCEQLAEQSQGWSNFINWLAYRKLILTYRQ